MLIDRYAQFRVNAETLSKNLQKYENNKMSSVGMRGIHALMLFHLGRHPQGMTVTELANACEVDKALSSRVAAELLEGGYAEYVDPDKKNYRNKMVLTRRGKGCLRRVTLWVCDAIRDLKDEITRDELNTFFRVMMVLNNYLGNIDENADSAVDTDETGE